MVSHPTFPMCSAPLHPCCVLLCPSVGTLQPAFAQYLGLPVCKVWVSSPAALGVC